MGQTINPFGKKITKVETEFCGRKLSLEVGRVGFRTSASVIGALRRHRGARHRHGRQQADRAWIISR